MGPEPGNKLILQLSVLAGVLQLGLQCGKAFSGRIPLLDSGGFVRKVFRLADLPQSKRRIEVFDLPLQSAVRLP